MRTDNLSKRIETPLISITFFRQNIFKFPRNLNHHGDFSMNFSHKINSTFLFFFSFFFPFSIIAAAPGDLDPTFSQDGKIIQHLGSGTPDAVYATALQNDGKIVVAATRVTAISKPAALRGITRTVRPIRGSTTTAKKSFGCPIDFRAARWLFKRTARS